MVSVNASCEEAGLTPSAEKTCPLSNPVLKRPLLPRDHLYRSIRQDPALPGHIAPSGETLSPLFRDRSAEEAMNRKVRTLVRSSPSYYDVPCNESLSTPVGAGQTPAAGFSAPAVLTKR